MNKKITSKLDALAFLEKILKGNKANGIKNIFFDTDGKSGDLEVSLDNGQTFSISSSGISLE
jgi:hypothetical protein